MRTNWWSDVSSTGSGICHTSLNAMLIGSIWVDLVVRMIFVLLNGEYRIAKEPKKMMWDNDQIGHCALLMGSNKRVTEWTG